MSEIFKIISTTLVGIWVLLNFFVFLGCTISGGNESYNNVLHDYCSINGKWVYVFPLGNPGCEFGRWMSK